MMMFSRFHFRMIVPAENSSSRNVHLPPALVALREFITLDQPRTGKSERQPKRQSAKVKRAFIGEKSMRRKISGDAAEKLPERCRRQIRHPRFWCGKKLPAEPDQRQQPEPFFAGQRGVFPRRTSTAPTKVERNQNPIGPMRRPRIVPKITEAAGGSTLLSRMTGLPNFQIARPRKSPKGQRVIKFGAGRLSCGLHCADFKRGRQN
jgi:hypothetical protein